MLNYGVFLEENQFERKTILPNNIVYLEKKEDALLKGSIKGKFSYKNNLILSCEIDEYSDLVSMMYYSDKDIIVEIDLENLKFYKVTLHGKINGKQAAVNLDNLEGKFKLTAVEEIHQEFSDLQKADNFIEYLKGVKGFENVDISYNDEYTGKCIFYDLLSMSEKNFKVDFRLKYL